MRGPEFGQHRPLRLETGFERDGHGVHRSVPATGEGESVGKKQST